MSVGSVISIALSAIAVGIAIWAAIESHRANSRADESNQIADKANEISSQALELAQREAPPPLSELIQVDKSKWALRNQSGQTIEILSVLPFPKEAAGLVRVPELPKIIDYGDKLTVKILGVMDQPVEMLIIEWRFVGSAECQQSRRNIP